MNLRQHACIVTTYDIENMLSLSSAITPLRYVTVHEPATPMCRHYAAIYMLHHNSRQYATPDIAADDEMRYHWRHE